MWAMADKHQKWPENAPGMFFVDENCIASKFCVSVAPDHFKMDEDGHAYVFRQPATPEEEKLCRDALEGCPVAAIGDDGGSESDD
jgi:ferredoxin